MQDAENVAAPEAAEERAEPARQQPAAEPPLEEEPAGPGAPEAARVEDAEEEAAAGPEPELKAQAEEVVPGPAASPPPSQEPAPQAELPAPAQGSALAEQVSDPPADGPAHASAEEAGGPEGSAAEAEPRVVENGEADEPSFSDPEDFVDDVSEEGEAREHGGTFWLVPLPGHKSGEGVREIQPGREGCPLQLLSLLSLLSLHAAGVRTLLSRLQTGVGELLGARCV